MRRVATICARGGSKGVPGKNIRMLAGRPLIAHSVEQALAADRFAIVAVSSDSAAILDAAREAGAHLLIERPPELATDEIGKVPAILHGLEAAEEALGSAADTLVDLAATSPLRSVEDIRGVLALLEESGSTNVITGAPAKASAYFSQVERDADGIVALCKGAGFDRRQDAPATFDMNGSIYAWKRQAFVAAPGIFYPDTRLFEMPEERSIDIDTELDFAIAEMLAERRGDAA